MRGHKCLWSIQCANIPLIVQRKNQRSVWFYTALIIIRLYPPPAQATGTDRLTVRLKVPRIERYCTWFPTFESIVPFWHVLFKITPDLRNSFALLDPLHIIIMQPVRPSAGLENYINDIIIIVVLGHGSHHSRQQKAAIQTPPLQLGLLLSGSNTHLARVHLIAFSPKPVSLVCLNNSPCPISRKPPNI